jgi:glycosyltransferase involved in cell wall biosynthesis
MSKTVSKCTAISGTRAVPPCVAICSVGELFGGVERHILSLLDGLRTAGVQVVLLLFQDGELAYQARRQGFQPVILRSNTLFFPRTCHQLALLLKEAGIWVVHTHGYKATVYCAFARYWHPFALVKTEHGLPEPMAKRPLQFVRDRLYHFLDLAATRMTARVVCYVTEELRAQRATGIRAGLRTVVIPNGVVNMEGRQFTRPAELRAEWFNIAIVGRLDAVKGHDLAITALAMPEVAMKTHLHIVGTGPTESALRALAQKLGLVDRVHFWGFRRNVYDYLAHCDVLMIPSLHEGLPYTLLEAMALGTPIIASRVGGLAEVLRDGTTAVLIPPRSPAFIAPAITELQSRPDYRRKLGENAQELQRGVYSITEMSARYLAIYTSVSEIA